MTTEPTKPAKTSKTQTMKPNQAHPLDKALRDLATDAEALAGATTAQAARNGSLAQLQATEAATLAEVASETLDFRAGAAALAENRGEQDALGHAIELRALELTGNANRLLADGIDLKGGILAALAATTGGILLERQAQVGSLLESWGGPSTAPSSPVAAAAIAATCPKIAKLDGHRERLEKWQFLDGFAALARVAGAALAELAKHPVPAAVEPLRGGYSEQSRAQIAGWRGSKPELEVVADFANSAEAAAAFGEIRARSGFLGFVDVRLFDGASPRNQVRFPNENLIQLDLHQLRELTGDPGFDGRSVAFLGRIAAWLA